MNANPMNDDDRGKESDGKLSREKKMEDSEETGNSDTSWPHIIEEEYIVFCFTEDGEIDVVEDRKPETSSSVRHTKTSNSRPISRKLSYKENVEKGYSYSQRETSYGSDKEIYQANEQESLISFEKGEEKRGSTETDAEWAGDDEVIEINHTRDEVIMTSSESNDYNQSASNRSFAFPVLGWEWVGSPVHMPEPDNSPYLKKHRARCHFLHCCRF